MSSTGTDSHRLWPVAVGINAGLGLASLALWGVAYFQGLSWRADFTAFYTGWSLVVGGRGPDLYDVAVQTATQQQILGGRYLAGGLLSFNYPPHVALLFAPLGLLSLDSAYLVWSVLQLVLLMWLCRMLWKHLETEGVDARNRVAILSAVVALPAVGVTFLLGAFSVFLLVCLLGFAFALRRGNDRQAALWVILLTLKPQVAVVPALVFVAARRWRAVGLAVAGSLVIVAGTTLALGRNVWLGFTAALLRTLGAADSLGVAPSAMHNLRGILVSVLGDGKMDIVNAISLLAFLASLLLVMWLWSGRRVSGPAFDLRMSATLLLGILFNLHVNPQDSVFLAGPALLFWHYLRSIGRGTPLLGALALGCPVLFWVTERISHVTAVAPVPSIVMVVLGVWMLCSYLGVDTESSQHSVRGG